MSRRKLTWLVGTLLVVVGLIVGAVLGVLIVAPNATDIRNACVADFVVPRAGLPPTGVPEGAVAPGPPNATPRPVTGQ